MRQIIIRDKIHLSEIILPSSGYLQNEISIEDLRNWLGNVYNISIEAKGKQDFYYEYDSENGLIWTNPNFNGTCIVFPNPDEKVCRWYYYNDKC